MEFVGIKVAGEGADPSLLAVCKTIEKVLAAGCDETTKQEALRTIGRTCVVRTEIRDCQVSMQVPEREPEPGGTE